MDIRDSHLLVTPGVMVCSVGACQELDGPLGPESFPHSAFMTTAILREKVGQVGRVPCPRLCVGMRL